MKQTLPFRNPFKPGAGHMPPYLAGREQETSEFKGMLDQKPVLQNIVLTGLRGVGKTVLLETFRPIAQQSGWAWIGTDLSESASLTEENLAIRLLTDLSVFTSSIVLATRGKQQAGFSGQSTLVQDTLGYQSLEGYFRNTPGLIADKLKRVLELIWQSVDQSKCKGIVFAYDEAQILADHRAKEQYPLSVLLDVFQSLQRKGIPYLLVLTGLPTLFPKLVEARTFAERMFHVLTLDRLGAQASREAIKKPIADANCPVKFSEGSVQTIAKISGGYPYFIQFVCREVYELFIQQGVSGQDMRVPVAEIEQKLDTDFFSGRWSRATDRQRDLMTIIADLEHAQEPDFEFSVQEVTALSKKGPAKPFSPSHVNQLLSSLADAGLVYKNRHGSYSFAVPLLGRYIRRQHTTQTRLL